MFLLTAIGAWGLLGISVTSIATMFMKDSRWMGILFLVSFAASIYLNVTGVKGHFIYFLAAGAINFVLAIYLIDNQSLQEKFKGLFKKQLHTNRFPE